MTDFSVISSFIFDLDNTLYPADCRLFDQIDKRMTAFIAEHLDLPAATARRLQKHYYAKYGTTLNGLMTEHQLPPHDFLAYVHDIDLSSIDVNQPLQAAIGALPGKSYIFTNGAHDHAERVAAKLGILHLFAGIFDIAAADFVPKPHAQSYTLFARHFGVDLAQAAMFEDMADNLKVPNEMGATTILIETDMDWLDDIPVHQHARHTARDHIDYTTRDLTSFLTHLTTGQM